MNSPFNPMNFFQNMMQQSGFPNSFPQSQPQAMQNVPINQQQFKQFLPNITDSNIEQLVNQARQQGISENDIQNGLNFIRNMR